MIKSKLLPFVLAIATLISCNSEQTAADSNEVASGAKQDVLDSNLIDTLTNEEVLEEENLNEVLLSNGDTLYSIANNWNYNTQLEPSIIEFENFDVRINSFFWVEERNEDTMLVYEDVGEYLDGREFQIIPKNDKDTFLLYIRAINNIYEMMDSDSLGLIGDWESWDQFVYVDTSKRYFWKPLEDHRYVFPSMGVITSDKMEELNFRDTAYWYHGEMSGTYFGTAFLFDGHIVDYYIYTSFVIIERHNNGLKESKVLRVEFSYGC